MHQRLKESTPHQGKRAREKHPFTDNSRRSQSEKQWASRGRETAVKKTNNKSPRLTPLTGREHVGGGSRGKSPDSARGPCPKSRE